MLDQLAQAFLAQMALWPVLYAVLGVASGILVGAIPGLNQGMLMVLTLPLTFYMPNLEAQILLIGMYVGGVSGSLISAILIGVPGTPGSVMTVLDGHAMAKRGDAARALAIGVAASFFGGLFSWLALVVLSVPLASVALRFSSFEYFAMVLTGLVLIASVGEGSLDKGLLSGLLGVLAAMPGLDPVSSDARFTFGTTTLQAGFEVLPVLLGIFAVSQILSDPGTPPGSPPGRGARIEVGFWDILRSVGGMVRHWVNLVRSSVIGTWIGILPGIGANIGAVLSYTIARTLSRTPERYGTGIEEGVIASEAGNNATVGGALIPMIALGIPGSPADVILMAALIFHSIQPSPMLMIEHPDTFYGIIVAYLIANILMLVLMLLACVWLGRVLSVPRHYLVPFVLVFCVVGSLAIGNRMFDLWVLLGFGLVGFLLKLARFPLAPFVIGLVLAPIAEVNLRSALMASDGSFLPFLTRPVSGALLLLAGVVLVWSLVQARRFQLSKPAAISG